MTLIPKWCKKSFQIYEISLLQNINKQTFKAYSNDLYYKIPNKKSDYTVF